MFKHTEIKGKVSFAIVTWNSAGEIENCISSIFEDVADAEVIVADNCSSDNTREILDRICEKFNNVKVILNEENLGYTKACNQAMTEASGEFIFLLNPDTRLNKGVTTGMIDIINNGNIGAVAPQLLNDDGSVQQSCRNFPCYRDMYFEIFLLSKIFPGSNFFNRWKMGSFDHNREHEVEQPMAAAMMIKRNALEKTGLMDETFEMFFSDVDFCKRIIESGKKIIFSPATKVFHSKGVSVYKDRKRMIKIWTKDCLRFFKKYDYNSVKFFFFKITLKSVSFVRTLTV